MATTFYSQHPSPHTNGHEYIDLGLPSGVLWATCNVGADSPEECGDYFAWGEIKPKMNYNWSTYKWCNGSYDTQVKYRDSFDETLDDNKTVLELSDDAANANWGGDWRMPTKKEQHELITKCTWTMTTKNGVQGYIVVGPNGKSIFLPIAGYRRGSDLHHVGSFGYYWSSSIHSRNEHNACCLYIAVVDVIVDFNNRYYGQTVRPVISVTK